MFDFLGSIIMEPLYFMVSGIILLWHNLISLVLDGDSGWAWAFSIMGLTITIRALMIPLFVRQIKSSRNMQLLAPQLKELREKYGHDRERFAQEQMKLFKDTGTNPLASCMPLLLQMPVFFALFRTIDQAARKGGEGAKGLLSFDDAESLQNATWLGGRIADTFIASDNVETKLIAAVMVVLMCATQFLTQKQLMAKNMPPEAMTGQYAQTQKMMLYVLPVVFAVSGVAFPLGVLVYWTTTNFWTMGQQFWVIRNNPTPGTDAFKKKQERDRAKGKTVQVDPAEQLEALKREAARKANANRQQPQRKPRSQRKPVTPPNQANPRSGNPAKRQADDKKPKKK